MELVRKKGIRALEICGASCCSYMLMAWLGAVSEHAGTWAKCALSGDTSKCPRMP